MPESEPSTKTSVTIRSNKIIIAPVKIQLKLARKRRKSRQLSDESCSHLSVIARIGGCLSQAVTLRVERDPRDGLPVAGIARPA